MFSGTHFLLYSQNPEEDRAFLRDVLEFESVDAGQGWLIFALPPAEIAVHPANEDSGAPTVEDGGVWTALYLMCEDLPTTMKRLQAKKVEFTAIHERPWGTVTSFRLPSGGDIGLYQPKHPVAVKLGA